MRKVTNINQGWRFLKAAIPAAQAMEYAARGEAVTLPHTWNAIDGQDGGNDYHRGTCWYVRELTAEETAGERLFLEINGAAMTAEVYLNGEKLCRHEGGYSTFRVELTGKLAEKNTLAISVNNEDNTTVYPQKADFTFYGGLYRAVNLIAVPEEHFELLKDGTPGIKVTPVVDLEKKCATVTVETWHNGKTVDITVNGETKTVEREASFLIENVHLWDGVEDPFLYTATAKLPSGDEVSTRFGCRVFRCDPEKGFFLNGRSYPLRGVSRHQDLKGKGNALSYEDHKADMAIIRELGANTLRLAHYQHAQEFYDLCDENGIVVWAEIPYITMHMHDGRENTLSQMRELITQCYNHPCIAVWGLSNEITAASAVNEELLENHRALNELCHRMDPTRLTTMADVFMLEIDSPILEIPDINSYNLYFGWYLGELEQTDEFFDEYPRQVPRPGHRLQRVRRRRQPRLPQQPPREGRLHRGVPGPVSRAHAQDDPGPALPLGHPRVEPLRLRRRRAGRGRQARREPEGPRDLRPPAAQGRLLSLQGRLEQKRALRPPVRQALCQPLRGGDRDQGLLQPGRGQPLCGRHPHRESRAARPSSASASPCWASI